MVDPSARRRGIATALLDAALRECGARAQDALLIVPRGSRGGHGLARGRGARLDHSEHALVLHGAPAQARHDPRIELRDARPDDVDEIARLLADGFGSVPPDLAQRLVQEHDRTRVIQRDGRPVGTLRVTRDGESGGVYGFVIDACWRGRGIGRDALARTCRELLAAGARRVGLEVAADNDHALSLYTSLGFVAVSTEDYYALELGRGRS